MTDTLTPEKLAEIEARANKATPGPWAQSGQLVFFRDGPLTKRVAQSFGDEPEADATFIARAREDIPALLAYVRALEARLAERSRLLSEAQTFLETNPKGQEPGSEMFTWRHQVDEELKEPQP